METKQPIPLVQREGASQTRPGKVKRAEPLKYAGGTLFPRTLSTLASPPCPQLRTGVMRRALAMAAAVRP